ncbi:ABC transporter permease [Aliiruegeria haliotis]|uniref:ABC transporter permease n=1 Tax=Aliiruegeria haliotis TaxID=1280846 RepID=UPI001B807910|nr:FtsX-like permease family protein [Aliiruegeria haliotis]
MRNAARIARRELRGGLQGFRVFLLCLALGVAAIAAVGSVRTAIEAGLASEGAVLLGGDAEMSFTYRYANEAERAWMTDTARIVSEVVDFRSMAVVGEGDAEERGLTQVKGVDAAYPIYGEMVLSPSMGLDTALEVRDGVPGAVMERVLADRLGLSIGDPFRMGTQEFRLSALIEREPDNAGDGFGLGPRTLVRTEALAESSLLAAGTLFETRYRLAFADGTDVNARKGEALDLFRDTGLRWRDSRNGAPGVAAFVDRLGAFLVLVGLAGLAVGGIGVSAAVRAYLEGKREVIAVLKTLGADSGTIFAAYLLQIAALAVLGVCIGLVLGAVAPLALAPVIEARLPVPAEFGIYPAPLAEAALYGFLTALLFTLWPLARTEDIRAAALFRDAVSGRWRMPRLVHLVLTILVATTLVGAAASFSGVPRLALYAAAGIIASLGLLALAAFAIRALSRKLGRSRALRGRPSLRLAFGAVGGPGGETTSVVLSLGLGLTVLAAVGQIDANLRSAIARDLPTVAPSYFVVDIQPGQLEGFLERVENDPGVSRVETAPMLRGIITRINDLPARDVVGDHWVINGDRGVTYSAEPAPQTRILDGEWWPAGYSGDPQVSFAAEEAEEMGLALGDRITVNILGRDITARVTSFREVDFSTAGIGFIMSMNPAALAGAPHSHIATIYADPASEAAILRDLARSYPNITAIRVRDAIDRVSEVLAGIAAAITYGAMATLLTGVVVLIGAAAAGERMRVFEAAVLKTVGAVRGQVLGYFAIRSALLGGAAGLVAILCGAISGWAVTTFVMETDYTFEPISALLIVTGGVLANLLAGLGFAWRPLSARPAHVLRGRE